MVRCGKKWLGLPGPAGYGAAPREKTGAPFGDAPEVDSDDVTLAGDDRFYSRTDGKSMTFPAGPTSITG